MTRSSCHLDGQDHPRRGIDCDADPEAPCPKVVELRVPYVDPGLFQHGDEVDLPLVHFDALQGSFDLNTLTVRSQLVLGLRHPFPGRADLELIEIGNASSYRALGNLPLRRLIAQRKRPVQFTNNPICLFRDVRNEDPAWMQICLDCRLYGTLDLRRDPLGIGAVEPAFLDETHGITCFLPVSHPGHEGCPAWVLHGEELAQFRRIPAKAYLLQYLGLDTFSQPREEYDAGVIGAVYLAIRLRFEKTLRVELLAKNLSLLGCVHPADEPVARQGAAGSLRTGKVAVLDGRLALIDHAFDIGMAEAEQVRTTVQWTQLQRAIRDATDHMHGAAHNQGICFAYAQSHWHHCASGRESMLLSVMDRDWSVKTTPSKIALKPARNARPCRQVAATTCPRDISQFMPRSTC